MHRALHILEVVEMVCAQIPLRQDQSSPELARLARTSQLFLDPALNALWRHQRTLVNLLKVMPLGLWDIDEDREASDENCGIRHLDVVSIHGAQLFRANLSNSTQTLLRAVISSDWDRFLLYARRVRSFVLDENLKTPEAYETLALRFPQQSILPHLEKLDWFPVIPNYFGYVRLFLTPTITNLHLTIESFSDLTILSTAALTCPRLTEVGLGCISDSGLALVSKFVCHLHHLESLVVGCLDEAAFSHIARLPNLRYLWLMSPASLRCIALKPDPHSPHFPVLRKLKLESIDEVHTLLAFLGKSSLVEMTIVGSSFPSPPTQSVSKQFYAALAQHCGPSSLQKLTLQNGYYSTSTPNAGQLDIYSVGGDALEPLLVFRNLVMLQLSHSAGFHLDDLASAWPRIEILQLRPHSSCRLPPRVTLEGVYAFAKHCPSLKSLTIAFDATTVPKIKINGKRLRVVQDRLELIDVAHSPIRKRRSVAKFLGAIFPSLHIISTSHDRYDEIEDAETVGRDKLWMDVQDYLQ
ncbi:hypothetical protein C8R46DRAFT_1276087 [Mycena filopes]|nr:hypothetical protein C8R46DRAFT_1276087 [Mycena filopes]